MKQQCKEYIRKKGVDTVTMEELVQELLPKGRCMFVSKFIIFHFSLSSYQTISFLS